MNQFITLGKEMAAATMAGDDAAENEVAKRLATVLVALPHDQVADALRAYNAAYTAGIADYDFA